MSGHSKWANIKRKKGANDAIRAKVTTKIGREITVAARLGGGDPVGNMRLKLALSKAKANNIPKENIKRAIQKGLGTLEGSNYEELVYEGYGPFGVAIMLDIMTDNRNRTAADIRHLFSKHGGNMGETGCVGWMFKKRAIFILDKDSAPSEEELLTLLLDVGIEDLKSQDEVFEIVAMPEDFSTVLNTLTENKLDPLNAEISMLPDTMVKLQGVQAEKLLLLLDALEDHDDVQNVYSNADIDDESM